VIEPGLNGLVEPLFDVERLTETALRVLADPAAFAPLGLAARQTIEERYSLEVCILPLADFFERVANQKAKREGREGFVRAMAKVKNQTPDTHDQI
jgi:glycosyltransferase involved in cell wall biosynthesis